MNVRQSITTTLVLAGVLLGNAVIPMQAGAAAATPSATTSTTSSTSTTDRPVAPTNVVVAPGNERGSINVTWTPADTTRAPVTSQIVWLYVGDAKLPAGKIEIPYWYTATPLIRLTAGATVSVSVTAVNSNGWSPESVRSNKTVVPTTTTPTTTAPPTTASKVSVLGRPVAPTNVVVAPGKERGRIEVSWTPADTAEAPVTSQIVWLYVGDTKLPASKIEIPYWYTATSLIKLTTGATVSVSVTAVNSFGWSPESVRSNKTVVPTTTAPTTSAPPTTSTTSHTSVNGRPVAPTNVVIKQGSDRGRIEVSWTPADKTQAPVTSQIVWLYVGTAKLPAGKIEVPTWYTKTTLINLTAGATVSVSVTAVNSNGWSPESVRSNTIGVP
ncbi:MAG: fibronectin type III domain-containing protein [Acidimicrobiia bacterium]